MSDEVQVVEKKFVVIPRDAFNVMTGRFVDLDQAIEAASDRCAETGIAMYVVEIRAVASRADRPIKVRKL